MKGPSQMTTATTAPASARPSGLIARIEPYMGVLGPLVMIVMIAAFMGVFEPTRYFRLSNMNQILLDAALYMPMAMAMTFVITQRGIDLSIGSVAALSAIIIAFLMKQYGFPAWVCVFIALGLGGTMGLINGLVITKLKVPDLIGTLGDGPGLSRLCTCAWPRVLYWRGSRTSSRRSVAARCLASCPPRW